MGSQVPYQAPFPAGLDFASAAGADLLLKTAQDRAEEIMTRKGKLSGPFGCFVARRNPQNRLSYAKPKLGLFTADPRFAMNHATKDELLELIQEDMRRSDALGLAMVMEANLLVAPPPPGVGPEEHVRNLGDRPVGWVAEHPDRMEVVVVSLEHVAVQGTRLLMSEIVRDHVGRSSLTGWSAPQYDGVAGRFAGILAAAKGG
jgi:hypothetical protein